MVSISAGLKETYRPAESQLPPWTDGLVLLPVCQQSSAWISAGLVTASLGFEGGFSDDRGDPLRFLNKSAVSIVNLVLS